MKLIKFIAVLIVVNSLLSCTQQSKVKKTLKSEIDSVSYSIGLNIGQQMRINGKEIDADLFIEGYLNGRDSSNFLIPNKEIGRIVNSYFQKKQVEQMKKREKQQAEKNMKEFGDYKKQGEEFLKKNKDKKDVKTTKSGLQYKVIKEGKGEAPKVTSTVKVNYKGTLIDGTVFDSSEKGKPIEFALNQVIKGWTEGLQLMKPGAKYEFFIPQELAYGSQQKGDKIKPFSPLIFEVELLEVIKK